VIEGVAASEKREARANNDESDDPMAITVPVLRDASSSLRIAHRCLASFQAATPY
jgi:hypothetical protein